MIMRSRSFSTQIKRAYEKKDTENDKKGILKETGNKDPRRKNKEHSYEAFDSKW
jgi:hypothetical protein